MSIFDPLADYQSTRVRYDRSLIEQQMIAAENQMMQGMGQRGFGGFAQELRDPYRGMTPAAPPREKTVREELQSEINDWLQDV